MRMSVDIKKFGRIMPDIVVSISSGTLAQDAARAIETAIQTLGREPKTSPLQNKSVILPTVVTPRIDATQNTSYRMIRAVAEALRRLGTGVSIGGNPPKALPGPQMLDLFEKAGIASVARTLGTPQLLDQRTEVVALRSGRTAKFFAVAQYLTGGVSPVFAPRLRPDDLLMFGAVRGATSGVPGFKREEVRLAPEQVVTYADQLVDLTEAIRPALIVLETGLDDPAVLVGASAYAVDMVAAVLLGLDPNHVATIAAAKSRGLGPSTASDINFIDSGNGHGGFMSPE